jgi:hypothetical protein
MTAGLNIANQVWTQILEYEAYVSVLKHASQYVY